MEIDGNCDVNERLKPQTSNTKLKKSYREKQQRERENNWKKMKIGGGNFGLEEWN